MIELISFGLTYIAIVLGLIGLAFVCTFTFAALAVMSRLKR